MKKRLTFVLILMCVQMPLTGHALPENGAPSRVPPGYRMKFRHITDKQGLSHNSVYAILQDRNGFMWFGTYVGLCKYDGYTMTVYTHDPDDPMSLSHNAVVALHEDQDGMLWVGTAGGGVNRFDPMTEQFHRYCVESGNPDCLSHENVWSLLEDSAGSIWIGTKHGLNRFDPSTEQFAHYFHDPDNPDSLSGNTILTVYEDRHNTLWIGTSQNGLNRFEQRTNRFIHYRHDADDPFSLSHDSVRAILEDQDGTLWIGTHGGGLLTYDRETEQFTRYTHQPGNTASLSSNLVYDLAVDDDGRVWVGTVDNGLNRFQAETHQFVQFRNVPYDHQSLNDNQTRSMYVSRSGLLWIGTKIGGINLLDRRSEQFFHYRYQAQEEQHLNRNTIYAFHEDEERNIWTGTRGSGFYHLDRRTGRTTQYLLPDVPSERDVNRVWTFARDETGVLWIGTSAGGFLFQKDTRRFLSDTDESCVFSTIRDKIYTILRDTRGEFWVGTYNTGLYRLDQTKTCLKHYAPQPEDPESLSGKAVTAVYETRDGTLWIGTGGHGLNQFVPQTETFLHYTHNPAEPESISDNSIKSLYEDQAGRLWIGTRDGGLNTFDRTHKTFRAYRTQDGLPNDTVYGILEDEEGNLWLSTNMGISRFNPTTETFQNYHTSHGVQGKEFNTGASYKTRDGMMLFGGFNGFNAFYPSQIEDNSFVPPVVLTDFHMFHKPVAIGDDSALLKPIYATDSLTLSYRQNIFSFEFAALSYAAPEQNRYAYRMKGFEKEWNTVGSSRRRATYTNLPPGDYLFQVKGSNEDGLWNTQGVSLRLTIRPPWQKTRGFYTFLLLSIGLCGYIAYQARIEQIKARQQELETQVDMRTRQLQESEARFRALSEATFEGIAFHKHGVLVNANEQYFEMFGYLPTELLGTDAISVTVAPESLPSLRQYAFSDQKATYEAIGMKKDGTRFCIKIHSQPTEFLGKHVRVVAIRDITEWKRMEQDLKTSLQEKEVLLKEIHHRVKNNLQMVSSLLKFQAEHLEDHETISIFQDCQTRIQAMSLIHENLYKSHDLEKVEVSGYLRNLVVTLVRLYAHPSVLIQPMMQFEQVEFTIDTAIACGLIVNELVSNALKYAFPVEQFGGKAPAKRAEIQVMLHQEGERQWHLCVGDNGTGIPDYIDIQSAPTLGLRLVRMLTRQIGGTIQIEQNRGTVISISFPDSSANEMEKTNETDDCVNC